MSFDEKLTVIVGENGSGKTSIIDSITKLLTWFASRFIKPNNRGTHLLDTDTHVNTTDYAQVAGQFSLNPETTFSLSLVRPQDGWAGEYASELQATTVLGHIYRLLAEHDTSQVLPFFACYPVERSSRTLSQHVAESQIQRSLQSRFKVYANILNLQARSSTFIERYIELSNLADHNPQQYQKKREQVDAAIESAVPFVSDIRVDRVKGNAELRVRNFGSDINFTQLSQGQKTLAAMVGGIALRMMALNPHMSNPLSAQGIILIDEIDLHLHPSLQQRIIPSLVKTFSGVQWIITTHSPHVLSTIDNRAIRIIRFENDTPMVKTPSFQTRGVVSSTVLEQIMDTHAIPSVPEAEKTTQYLQRIQDNSWKTQEGQALKTALIKHFGADHPVIQNLNSQERLAELKQNYSPRSGG
ncbi:MAG TPA: AAA family ATPase [Burkholderiaceae bacterium]|nr:AAA family ATPase [Burkholderiaceae bacterium]